MILHLLQIPLSSKTEVVLFFSAEDEQKRILAKFVNENNESIGAPFDLPTNIDTDKLQQICNALLANVCKLYVV